MDATDRQLLIEQLERDNDASRAEIERRRVARDSDPAAYDRREREHSAAISHDAISHDEWAELVGGDYVQKFGSDRLPAPAAEPLRTASFAADNTPAEDSDDVLIAAFDRFADAIEHRIDGELVKRDRKIGELEGELREIRGMLGATLQLLGTGKPPKKLWVP